MSNSQKLFFNLILLLIFVMPNLTLASEQNKTQTINYQKGLLQDIQRLNQQNTDSALTSPDEAMRVANQYQSISNNIKSKGESLTSLNDQSIFNISIVSNLKNIINEIELLSQNLIDLIMPGAIPHSPDSAKVDAIINKLELQQKTLSGFIQTQPSPSIHPQAPFNPDNYDRPKENTLQIFK